MCLIAIRLLPDLIQILMLPGEERKWCSRAGKENAVPGSGKKRRGRRDAMDITPASQRLGYKMPGTESVGNHEQLTGNDIIVRPVP